MSANLDDVWALFRIQFPHSSEWVQSLVPWGGDRAVIITTDGVYIARADEKIGFVIHQVFSR